MADRKSHAQEDANKEWRKRPWWQHTGPFLWTILIVGLAAPILSYVFMMVSLGWREPVIGGRNAAPLARGDGTIYLFDSGASRRYLTSVGGDYEILLNPWRAYFASRNRAYQEVRDIGELKDAVGNVLVLPSAIALTSDERARIAGFQAAGGSVLATWATGSRDAAGEWQGWDFMQQLGVHVLGEIPAESDERQLTIVGETPITLNALPGQRVWMTRTSEPLLRIKGESVAARFTNWSRSAREEHSGEGAVVFTEGRSSRTVAFAFSESVWAAAPTATYQLIDNTLVWLQRQPALALGNWPGGHRAAQVIEMDTEEGFQNGRYLAAMLAQARLPATFFVLTSMAAQYPDELRAYAGDHEIAYHGDVHVSFKGQPAPEQERRLLAMKTQLASVSPEAARQAIGFRAPYEGYDATTEALLQQNGIRYHVTDPGRSEGQLPFFAKMDRVEPGNQLLVIPRPQRDDFNLLAATGEPARLQAELLSDLRQTSELGSLGLLSVHSQNFLPGSPLSQAMPGYLAEVARLSRSGMLWTATGGQVDAWWRDRQRISVAGLLRGHRLEMDVTVKGDRPVEAASVLVMLPFRRAVAMVRNTKVGEPKPVVRQIDDYRSQFVFSRLNPGNYAYQINFTDPQK